MRNTLYDPPINNQTGYPFLCHDARFAVQQIVDVISNLKFSTRQSTHNTKI